jgi:hypothetical protein
VSAIFAALTMPCNPIVLLFPRSMENNFINFLFYSSFLRALFSIVPSLACSRFGRKMVILPIKFSGNLNILYIWRRILPGMDDVGQRREAIRAGKQFNFHRKGIYHLYCRLSLWRSCVLVERRKVIFRVIEDNQPSAKLVLKCQENKNNSIW